jgi:hypothetical protein
MVSKKDTDLTVLYAACCTGVLALHAHTLVSLFEKSRLIDNQHALGISEIIDDILLEIVPHLVGVPSGAAPQVLDAVRRLIARLLGQRPAVLALDRAKQPLQLG